MNLNEAAQLVGYTSLELTVDFGIEIDVDKTRGVTICPKCKRTYPGLFVGSCIEMIPKVYYTPHDGEVLDPKFLEHELSPGVCKRLDNLRHEVKDHGKYNTVTVWDDLNGQCANNVWAQSWSAYHTVWNQVDTVWRIVNEYVTRFGTSEPAADKAAIMILMVQVDKLTEKINMMASNNYNMANYCKSISQVINTNNYDINNVYADASQMPKMSDLYRQ